MKGFHRVFITGILLSLFSVGALAQVDEICGEFGIVPSLEAPRLSAPLIYGKISVKATEATPKFPRISVVYVSRDQTPDRLTVGKTGYYCFKRTETGGSLIVNIDGVEMARRTLPSAGAPQHREDFDLVIDRRSGSPSPSVVSSKFYYPPNDRTTELYKLAATAQSKNETGTAIKHLKAIVAADPSDFTAWAVLGAHHLKQKEYSDSEMALRKSIELKQEYPAPWITVGRLRMEQGQTEAAIEIFKHAIELDPENARTHQYLGDAYLQSKQGTLGVESLREAIRIDPIGMAECHLMIARLYDLAKAKHLAALEFKLFLEKVPSHPEKSKFQRYIKEHAESPSNP